MALTESAIRSRVEARGWVLEKEGKVYRLVDANGTVVAGDWTAPGFYGLSLADLEKVLTV